VDVSKHNYQLAPGSPAVDAGEAIGVVTQDRQGTARPQGRAYDIGAFERVSSSGPGPPSGDVVLYAARAPIVVGNWSVVRDTAAAGGLMMVNADEGAPKLTQALARPDSYFELTFEAEAGRPYRLWLRGRAEGNEATNDAVFVQFSGSVNVNGAKVYRTGSTSAAIVNLEECGKCELAEWGWQDNGHGEGVLGPVIYFVSSGTQRIRIQPREDGLAIDQIVLSASAYLAVAPGAATGDATILPEWSF
jgi:hypothetical protein